MNQVCIVVPLYKKVINGFEMISLRQLFRVLPEYPVCIVLPESMKVPDYMTKYISGVSIERFPDYYFSDVASYSGLLLDMSFYIRFSQYEYIMIYQLDAFVFSDRLMEFVGLGLDYLGAPLNNHYWREYHVGNGGLSLRRVNTFLRVLEKRSIICSHHKRNVFENGEDNFWAFCGINGKIDFVVPDIQVASNFSTQSNCFNGLELIKKTGLPFGTHHFPKWNYDFWREYVYEQGYDLPAASDVEYVNTLENDNYYNDADAEINYIIGLIHKRSVSNEDFGLLESCSYSLWGGGEWGYRIQRICKEMGISISSVYDSSPEGSCIVSLPVNTPDLSRIMDARLLRDERIVVSTQNCEEEICLELKKIGMIENQDYIPFKRIRTVWDSLMNMK